MESCDLRSGSCQTSGGCCSESSSEEQCSCGGGCGGDPVKCSMHLWKESFHTALEEVMTDVLKARIQKAMGPKLEKAADSVMAAMDAKWQAKMAMMKAKMELMEKFQEEMTRK